MQDWCTCLNDMQNIAKPYEVNQFKKHLQTLDLWYI